MTQNAKNSDLREQFPVSVHNLPAEFKKDLVTAKIIWLHYSAVYYEIKQTLAITHF
jgi:hypothetical protein